MHNIHTLVGPESRLFGTVEEKDGEFRIVGGWNLGQWTAEVRFPNINTARTYLAGKWNVPSMSVVLHATEEVPKVLSIEERIVKLAKQLARGMILVEEFQQQMDRIISDEWEAHFHQERKN